MAKKPAYTEELEQLEHRLDKRIAELAKANEQLKQEIEERRLAEEALRESERFLQSVFDGIQDGISVLDRDLNIIRVNCSMEKMYAAQMPMVGKKCYVVYQQRESPCSWCPSLTTLSTGEVHSTIASYPSEKEPIGWISLFLFPLKDADGRVVGLIEYVKDITEHKGAEEEKNKLERQFHQAQKLEAIATLAGGIAHDFNNILGVITGCTELSLFDVPEGTRVHRHLMEVRNAVNRAKDLVKQILAFSR